MTNTASTSDTDESLVKSADNRNTNVNLGKSGNSKNIEKAVISTSLVKPSDKLVTPKNTPEELTKQIEIGVPIIGRGNMLLALIETWEIPSHDKNDELVLYFVKFCMFVNMSIMCRDNKSCSNLDNIVSF